MAYIPKAERDRIPDEDFGDVARRLYPIRSQDDVDSAAHLLGKAKDPEAVKRRIMAIAKRKKLKIPDAWEEKSDQAKMSAEFDGSEAAGGQIVKRGLIFEPGDYPDKRFSMTPEELALAAEEFQPVPLDLEHTDTVLNGRLGELRAVALDPETQSLMGEAVIPAWLSEAVGPGPLKTSCVWDRATKRLTGLSLVLSPRVPAAALMSAYAAFASRHDTPHGQHAVQEIHDTAARHGAVCSAGNAKMASRHEASAVQQAHDLAVDHGAKCHSGDAARPIFYNAPAATGKEKPMTFLDHLKALFTRAGVPVDVEIPEGGGAVPPAGATPPAAAAAPHPDTERLKALEARFVAEQTMRFQSEAAAFADGEVNAHRALPAERDSLVQLYLQAAKDDAASPAQVTFSIAGKPATGSRIDALKAAQAARTAHQLTGELLRDAKPGELEAVFNKLTTPDPNAPKPLTPERKAALMEMTPLGQSGLQAGRNNGQGGK